MKSKILLLEKSVQKLHRSVAPNEPHIYLDTNHPIVRINHERAIKYDYEACRNVNSFLHDKSGNNKIIIGAYGSGKTSAIWQYILWRAVTMPTCDDGWRRYKALIVRSSTPQLQSTTLQTWLDWTAYLPKPLNRTSNKLAGNKEYHYEIFDGNGWIDLKLYFLALDSIEAARNLDSFEATDAFLNEVRDILYGVWEKIYYRLGRYPAKVSFKKLFESESKKRKLAYTDWYPFEKQLIADTNAPSTTHWIYRLEQKKSELCKIYHQPPQIVKNLDGSWKPKPEADNLPYREKNYWLDMLRNGEDFANIYACGFYGVAKEGKLAYPQFSQTMHAHKNLEPVDGVPLLLTLDIGLSSLTPAGLLQQVTPAGIYLAIKEFSTDRSSTNELCQDIKLWLEIQYPGYELLIVYDPSAVAGRDLKDLKLQTAAAILEVFGQRGRPAKSNAALIRINAPKPFLNKLVHGEPAFKLDSEKCPVLLEAFTYKYCYKKKQIIGETEIKDAPHKTHPHSDVMDCCQYGCLEYGGKGLRSNLVQPTEKTDKANLADVNVL